MFFLEKVTSSNVVFASSERFSRVFVNAILGFLIAAKIGPGFYGELTFYLSISALLCVLNSFGTQHLISSLTSKANINYSFSVLISSFMCRFFISTFIVLIFLFIGPFLPFTIQPLVIISIILFLFSNIFLSSENLLYVFDEMGEVVKARYIVLLFGLAMKIYLLLYINESSLFLISYALESLLLSLLLLGKVYLLGSNFSGFDYVQTLKNTPSFFTLSYPLFLQEFFVIAYMKMPIYVLPYYSGFSELGIFSLANSIVTSFNFLGQSIVNSKVSFIKTVSPISSSSSSILRPLYKKLFLASLFSVGILSVLSFAIKLDIVYFLQSYNGIFPLIIILSLGLPFVYFNCADRLIYIVSGRESALVKKMFISFVFALFIIPTFCALGGPTGAALSVILVYCFATSVTNFYFYPQLAYLHLKSLD